MSKLFTPSSLYGMPDTRARAKEWAVKHGYKLLPRSTGLCVHALRRRRCPLNHDMTRESECDTVVYESLDHGRVWQRPDGSRFILAHVYADRVQAMAAAMRLCQQRGLVAVIDDTMGWYGFGTIPLRYDLPNE